MGAVAAAITTTVSSVGNALGDALESGAQFIGGDDGLFDKVGDFAGNVVSSVGNAVSDVGNFVIDKVVEPVAKAVDNTIQAAIDDPVGTAVKIAAISTGNPYIIAAANTGVALAKGADPEDALKAGAKAAVMYEVGSAVGEYVAPEAAAYFGPENAAAASAVTNAAASTVAAAAVGEDPYQALLASGVNSAAGVIAKQVPGYDSLSANQQRALKTTVAASLEGKDPSQALVNQALQVGINYVKSKDDGTNYGYEQAPNYVSETDALISGGLTEDDGLNYGYEQAPDYVFEADKKPTEVTTAPITTELPPPEQQDLPPAPDSGTNLSEAQKDYLESSMAGGDDEVISEILNNQLSPLTPGDATPLPPVIGVDLTEDDGSNYGYEQAPDYVPETSEELPEAVAPPAKDEISDLVDSGLVEDAGFDYGYEQAPDLSPIVEGNVSPFPPVTNVDLTQENIVPESVDRTPATKDEVDALVDSGLVEDAGTDYGYEQAAPEEVVAPVDTGLTEDDALPPPPVTNVNLAEENIVPESVERTPTTQDEVDALIDSGLVEQPPSFVADYNLSTEKDPLGIQASPPAYVFNPDGSVNYELADTQSGLGLQIPETPNLDSMGGGQGLTAPAFGKPDGTVSEEGVFYDYNPLTGNVAPRTPPVQISSGARPAPVQRPALIRRRPTQANTLDDLMLMMQGEPVTSDDQEELIKLVKASPYFDIRSPLDIGFFDVPTNQDPVKMAEGGYMDILFPKTQLTMDEILQILEGKYHG